MAAATTAAVLPKRPRSKYLPIGVKVRVVMPLVFERCGYPLGIGDIQAQRGDEVAKLVNAAAKAADLDIHAHGVYEHLCKAVCLSVLHKEKFGGTQRVIKQREDERYRNATGEVVAKRYVRTGVRVEGRSYGTVDGYEYDPPYLENVKTHCVYTLRLDSFIETLDILADNCVEITE